MTTDLNSLLNEYRSQTVIAEKPKTVIIPRSDYFKIMGFNWWHKLVCIVKDFFGKEEAGKND